MKLPKPFANALWVVLVIFLMFGTYAALLFADAIDADWPVWAGGIGFFVLAYVFWRQSRRRQKPSPTPHRRKTPL